MYVRCDKDCNPATPQPGSVLVTDVYGNSFRNWCVDYIGTDKDCAPDGTTGCAPQITILWTRHLSDNSDGTTSPYNDPPLFPTVFTDDVIDDVIREADGSPAILVLGLDQDRDLVVVTDGVQQAVLLEPSTTLVADTLYNHNDP